MNNIKHINTPFADGARNARELLRAYPDFVRNPWQASTSIGTDAHVFKSKELEAIAREHNKDMARGFMLIDYSGSFGAFCPFITVCIHKSIKGQARKEVLYRLIALSSQKTDTSEIVGNGRIYWDNYASTQPTEDERTYMNSFMTTLYRY